MEQIYTIPVNEAFEKVQEEGSCTCPFCLMYNRLEDNELDLIMGASMMEPDVRIKTNELGFCDTHLALMFERGKRLPLALMLESHLNQIAEDIDGSTAALLINRTGEKAVKRLDKLEHSCYICGRIEYNFKNMIETVLEPKGRHDPAIVHRARVVQDAASAIVLCDALALKFGTDWLR